MASDVKISALPAASAAALANEIPVNEADVSKKLTATRLADLIGVYKARLTSDHTTADNASATKAMEIAIPAVAGVYWVEAKIIAQSSATNTGIGMSLYYTGATTAGSTRYCLIAPSNSTTTAVSVPVDDVGASAGAFVLAFPNTAGSTSGTWFFSGGVATANTNMIYYQFAILTTLGTSGGNLELWHLSETAVNTTISAGTCLTVHGMS